MGNVEYAECYAELANAIVLQAFKDYRKALFKLVQEPEEWKHRSSKKKLERFFHSKWYRTLTELDPEILMQEAKRQADINVERWERGRAKARERAERKAAKRNLSAAAVISESCDEKQEVQTLEYKTKTEMACALLKQYLVKGDMASKEIYERLGEAGISRRTIAETKHVLGIQSYRKMRQWYWTLRE